MQRKQCRLLVLTPRTSGTDTFARMCSMEGRCCTPLHRVVLRTQCSSMHTYTLLMSFWTVAMRSPPRTRCVLTCGTLFVHWLSLARRHALCCMRLRDQQHIHCSG